MPARRSFRGRWGNWESFCGCWFSGWFWGGVVEGCWSFGLASSLDGDEDEGLEAQSEESIVLFCFGSVVEVLFVPGFWSGCGCG